MGYSYSDYTDPSTFLRTISERDEIPAWGQKFVTWDGVRHGPYNSEYCPWMKTEIGKWYYHGPRLKGQNHSAWWSFARVKNPDKVFSYMNGSDLVEIVGPASYVNRCDAADIHKWLDKDAIRNAAVLNVLRNLADGKCNLAVSLAELNETINTIATGVTTIANAYRAFRKRDFRKMRRIFQERHNRNEKLPASIMGTELEFRYGVMPIIYDVGNLTKAVADRYDRPDDVLDVKGFKQEVANSTAYDTSTPSSVSREVDELFACRYRVRARVDGPGIRILNQLGFTNPLSVAWELTPLSMVADWFLPIGDYFETLSSTQGLTFLDGYSTSYYRKVVKVGDYEYRLEQKSRDILTSFPSYQFMLPSPDISLWRLADAISLLGSTLK